MGKYNWKEVVNKNVRNCQTIRRKCRKKECIRNENYPHEFPQIKMNAFCNNYRALPSAIIVHEERKNHLTNHTQCLQRKFFSPLQRVRQGTYYCLSIVKQNWYCKLKLVKSVSDFAVNMSKVKNVYHSIVQPRREEPEPEMTERCGGGWKMTVDRTPSESTSRSV